MEKPLRRNGMARRSLGKNQPMAMELLVQPIGGIDVGQSVQIDPEHRRGKEYLRNLDCVANTPLVVLNLDNSGRIRVRNPNNDRSTTVTLGAILLR